MYLKGDIGEYTCIYIYVYIYIYLSLSLSLSGSLDIYIYVYIYRDIGFRASGLGFRASQACPLRLGDPDSEADRQCFSFWVGMGVGLVMQDRHEGLQFLPSRGFLSARRDLFFLQSYCHQLALLLLRFFSAYESIITCESPAVKLLPYTKLYGGSRFHIVG